MLSLLLDLFNRQHVQAWHNLRTLSCFWWLGWNNGPNSPEMLSSPDCSECQNLANCCIIATSVDIWKKKKNYNTTGKAIKQRLKQGLTQPLVFACLFNSPVRDHNKHSFWTPPRNITFKIYWVDFMCRRRIFGEVSLTWRMEVCERQKKKKKIPTASAISLAIKGSRLSTSFPPVHAVQYDAASSSITQSLQLHQQGGWSFLISTP